MEKSYTLAIDSERRLLTLRLAGFFDLDSVQRIDVARREAIGRMGRPAGT